MRNRFKAVVGVATVALLLSAFPVTAAAKMDDAFVLSMGWDGATVIWARNCQGDLTAVYKGNGAPIELLQVSDTDPKGRGGVAFFDVEEMAFDITVTCDEGSNGTSTRDVTVTDAKLLMDDNPTVTLSSDFVYPGDQVTATLHGPLTSHTGSGNPYTALFGTDLTQIGSGIVIDPDTHTGTFTFTVPDIMGYGEFPLIFDSEDVTMAAKLVVLDPTGYDLFLEDLRSFVVRVGEPAVFSVRHHIPSSYQVETSWQVDDGTGWAAPNPAKLNFAVDNSDPAKPTLTIIPTAAQDGLLVRAGAVAQPGNIMEFSRQATLTVISNPLHFTKHPQSVQVLPGYAYTFSYDHAGNPAPLWAIWQVNTGSGWNIPDPAAVNYGVGEKSLTIIPNVSQYNMQVRVMLVKPDMTTIVSKTATLLSPDYAIIQMPQTQAVKVNTLARFSVDYVGAPGTLFWQYSLDGANWLMFDPATVNYAAYGQTLDIVPTVALDGAYIRVTIYGINGEVLTSTPARLWVLL